MKKFLILIFLLIANSFPHFAFSMGKERLESSSYVTKAAHKVSYSEGNLTLRSPQTKEEWKSYHTIRIEEIHNRYCQGYEYDYQDLEEREEKNFSFVLVDSSNTTPKVVGAIRVDLLPPKPKDLFPDKEAALRWVGIHKDFQHKGFGRRMLALAEKFIRENGKILIRVPAEDYSKGFYIKVGYSSMEWPEGPHHPGEVSLGKRLQQ